MRDYRKEFDELLAASGGFYEFDDIMDRIKAGTMQSFATKNSWIITQVHEFPRKKVVELAYILGDRDDVVKMESSIREFAEEIGAELMIATGRDGWGRLGVAGWKRVSVNYVKEV